MVRPASAEPPAGGQDRRRNRACGKNLPLTLPKVEFYIRSMHHAALLSDLPDTPGGAAPLVPERIGRLLLLLQMLVGYGKDFAATLRQQTVTPRFRLALQARFGTTEIARILIRIGRALRLAEMLEAQLRRQAATGQDVMTRAEVARAQPCLHGKRSTTTADRRAADRGTDPHNQLDDDLPTEEQIAAMIRLGKLGVVIEQICRDLGLVPSVVSQQQWSDVHHALITYGGNFAGLIGDACSRINRDIYDASFTQPLTREAIAQLNGAIFSSPCPS